MRNSLIQSIRPNRIESLSDVASLELTVDGKIVSALNLSETGVAFRASGQSFQKDQVLDLNLNLGDARQIYQGKAQIAWVKPTAETNDVNVGAHFTSSVLSQDLPRALEYLGIAYRNIEQDRQEVAQLPNDFKAFVLDFKCFLHGLKAKLDQVETEVLPLSNEVKLSFKQAVELIVGPPAVRQIKEFTAQLDKLAASLQRPEVRRAAIKLFRMELNSYLSASPFTQRATSKPRGYAGDYEMMNQIYRDEFEGYSLYWQVIHKYSINESSSESVRYRKGYLIDWFGSVMAKTNGKVTIGNLASGPAREVVEYYQRASAADVNRCNFLLMDQDTEALLNSKRNIAQSTIERGLHADAAFCPVSVKDILERTPVGDIFAEYRFDLLYTAGLFDYLNQPIAKILTQELIKQVKSGGTLIIGNFHPSNPTKTISEFSADWRLIHRTEEQMMDLVPADLKGSAKIHADPQGIDLFLEITKG